MANIGGKNPFKKVWRHISYFLHKFAVILINQARLTAPAFLPDSLATTRAVLMLLFYTIMIYMLISMITLFMLQKLRLGINPLVIADCCYTDVLDIFLSQPFW